MQSLPKLLALLVERDELANRLSILWNEKEQLRHRIYSLDISNKEEWRDNMIKLIVEYIKRE